MKRRLWALLLTLAVTLTLLPATALAAAFDPLGPNRVPEGVQVYTFQGGVSHSGQTRLRFLWAAEGTTYIAMEVQQKHEAKSLLIRDGQETYTGEALGTYETFTIAGEDIPLIGGQKWQVLCYDGGFTPGSTIEAEITAGGHELTPAAISEDPGYGPCLTVRKTAVLLRDGEELDAAAVSPKGGETIRYTVLVENTGDGDTGVVTVTDSMWGPAPQIEAVTVDGETCSVADGSLPLDAVSAGAAVTITYDYLVPAELAGKPVRNTAAAADGNGETEDSVETAPVEEPGDLPPDITDALHLPAVTVTCGKAAVCGGTDVRATPRMHHFHVTYGPDKRTAVLTPDRAFDALYEQAYALVNGEGHRAAEAQTLRLTAVYDDTDGWQLTEGQTPVFYVTCDADDGGEETADVTVEHFLQREDGSYTVERTQTIPAPVGVEVTAQKLAFDGYELYLDHPETVRKGTVLADGSLVLRLYYNKTGSTTETADVTVEHFLQREDGSYTVERTQTIPAPVGVEVTAQKLAFDGYELYLDHPETVRKGTVLADGSLVLRLYYNKTGSAPETADVTVEYYFEQDGGSYALGDTKVYHGAAVGRTAHAKQYVYEGYVLDTTREGTALSGTVLADGSLTLKLFYSKDVKGGTEEGPGDGTPDRYQRRLTFRVVHGAWNDGTAAAVEKWVTLTDGTGAWSDTGSYTLLAADIPAVGARPEGGYRAGGWDVTPLAGKTVTGDAAFTYAYAKRSGGGSSGGGGSGGGGNGGALNTKDHYSYLIGYQDNRLRPYGPITRGEAATIFFRLLTDEARDDAWCQSNGYTDVPAELWCSNAISTLTHMGILDGYQDGTFRPYGAITRAQFAKLAVGFFETARRDYRGTFPDVPEEAWYAADVEAAARAGLIGGFEDGTFRPDEAITRAQACAIVNRALGRKPHEDHLLPKAKLLTWPDCGEGDWFYADMMEAANSHDYCWTTEKIGGERVKVEDWTKKLPQRDWAAFEHAWSTAHAAHGGEVQ